MTEFSEAVISGDSEKVKSLVQDALDKGASAEEIIESGLVAGMDVVGERFKSNEMYIPEVMVAARAMHAGLDILKPLLTESEMSKKGTIVIGTVKGDVHDIGKNLVAMMLEGAGFVVHDLGIDVPKEKFLEAARAHCADVIAVSSLLTTTMDSMAEVVQTVKTSDNNPGVMVIIGGAPISQEFADEIGADGYGENAGVGVDIIKKWLEDRK
ncbi:MAG: corrinoid protein [Thermoplasmata archaeon]|nr:MAG: corrinoid protein [Thermoplasmata archaeon]